MTNNSNSFGIYKARTIGSLFLIAFLAYGFGRNLFESEAQTAKYIGAFLILTNSIIVLFIGILLRKTLVQYNTLTGYIFFLQD
jgi:prolipoprotein diacylglyceryltransferase